MEKIIKLWAILKEFLNLSPEKRFIVALFVLIIGMGFVIKYQAGDLKIERELIKQKDAEVRHLNEQRILDSRLCDQLLFAQLQRSDSIKEKEKQDLIKIFDNHAEKLEKSITKKK